MTTLGNARIIVEDGSGSSGVATANKAPSKDCNADTVSTTATATSKINDIIIRERIEHHKTWDEIARNEFFLELGYNELQIRNRWLILRHDQKYNHLLKGRFFGPSKKRYNVNNKRYVFIKEHDGIILSHVNGISNGSKRLRFDIVESHPSFKSRGLKADQISRRWRYLKASRNIEEKDCISGTDAKISRENDGTVMQSCVCFTKEDEDILLQQQAIHGNRWKYIAEHCSHFSKKFNHLQLYNKFVRIKGRNQRGQQCSDVGEARFTQVEEDILLAQQAIWGNRWTYISNHCKELSKFNPYQLCNKWNKMRKKKKNQQRQQQNHKDNAARAYTVVAAAAAPQREVRGKSAVIASLDDDEEELQQSTTKKKRRRLLLEEEIDISSSCYEKLQQSALVLHGYHEIFSDNEVMQFANGGAGNSSNIGETAVSKHPYQAVKVKLRGYNHLLKRSNGNLPCQAVKVKLRGYNHLLKTPNERINTDTNANDRRLITDDARKKDLFSRETKVIVNTVPKGSIDRERTRYPFGLELSEMSSHSATYLGRNENENYSTKEEKNATITSSPGNSVTYVARPPNARVGRDENSMKHNLLWQIHGQEAFI